MCAIAQLASNPPADLAKRLRRTRERENRENNSGEQLLCDISIKAGCCVYMLKPCVNLAQGQYAEEWGGGGGLKLYISREKHVPVPSLKDAAVHLYDDGELIQ